MPIRVEFFGIPRRRAGVAAAKVEASTLGEAIAALARDFEPLADICNPDGTLRPGYLASINGTSFTSDPQAPLKDGDVVLLLTADVGG